MEEPDGMKKLMSDFAQGLLVSSTEARSAQQDLLPPSSPPNMTGTFWGHLLQTHEHYHVFEAEYDIIN